MHNTACATNGAAKALSDALMSKADAQDRNFASKVIYRFK